MLLTASCVTKALWRDKSYEETIQQFYVGADGRYVALIGAEYHYIFTDNSGLLKLIVSLRQKDVLTVNEDKSNLKLDVNNNVDGYIVMEGPFYALPPEDMATLNGAGFFPDRDLSIKINLKGRRYLSKYIGENQPLSNSHSIQKIRIYYGGEGVAKNIGKAAITPITVTIDAVLLIGKVALAPFDVE